MPKDTVPCAGWELTVHAPVEIQAQVNGLYSAHPGGIRLRDARPVDEAWGLRTSAETFIGTRPSDRPPSRKTGA